MEPKDLGIRLLQWKEKFFSRLRKRWWWFLLAPLMAFGWGLVMDRVNRTVNQYIDDHASLSALKPIAVYLWRGPWLHPSSVGMLVLGVCVLILIFHAYIETRPTKQRVGALLQPDVALAWGWTEEQIRNHTMESVWDKYIVVHNRSLEYVYNVQIAPVSLLRGLTFDLISEIEPGKKSLAVARWDGKSVLTNKYVEFFARAEQEATAKGWCAPNDLGRSVFKVPMAITYECKHVRWACKFEFVHDIGDESFFRKLEGGTA